MGRQRFGVNLVSLMVTLREEGRLPIRVIQWYLQTVHRLKLSTGAIVEAIHAAARKAQPAVAAILQRIRGSPVVHADETGWREDGATRSQQGSNSKMALASLFGTWRAKGLNPLSESRSLLVSPQL